jgi:hypothetical protein
VILLLAGGIGVAAVVLQAQYTFTLQSPMRVRFQWPLVVAPRDSAEEAGAAQADQFGHVATEVMMALPSGVTFAVRP